MLDTAFLYKPVLLVTIYLFAIHFLAMSAFPPFILVMVLWALVMRNLNDDGRYVKYSFFIILADFLAFTFQVGEAGIPGLVTVIYFPLGILTVLMGLMFIAVRNEEFYFKRTIKGMNPSDQKKAKKALKTKDPNDFQDVAKYVDWSYVS